MAYHIIHAVGDDTIGMVHCDGGSGIIKACNSLGLNYDLSAPEMHETNAAANQVRTKNTRWHACVAGSGWTARHCLARSRTLLRNAVQHQGHGTESR